MPQGKIKKGFFFYFGLFVLLLVAAFLVCLVIMMFNPGKSLLWMQYFTSNSHFLIEETTGENSQKIDWGSVTELYITTDYAKVVVENNSDPEREGNGVYVLNKAKGFAVSKNAEPFLCKVTQPTSSRVEIEVICPKGFLYFSKNVEIAVHKSQRVAGAKLRDDLKVFVETTDGDVDLGGPTTKAAVDAKLGQLTVKCSGKGDVKFSQNFDATTLTKLDISTNTGNIGATRKFSFDNQLVEGLQTNCNASFKTVAGDISFENLVANQKTITLSNQKGNMRIANVSAANLKFENCAQGNYVLNNVSANVDFSYSEDTIATPNFVFGKVNGNFEFSSTAGQSKPNIEIDSVLGQLICQANEGTLVVHKASGMVNVLGNSLSVDLTIAQENNNLVGVDVENGSATLRFLGSVSTSGVKISTIGAPINVYLTQNAHINAQIEKNNKTTPQIRQPVNHETDVSVNVGNLNSHWLDEYTLSINETNVASGEISIQTNSHINFVLM